jgi:hypothetical protein
MSTTSIEPIGRRLRCVALAVDDTTLYLTVEDALEDDTTIAILAEHTHLQLKEMLATRNSIDDLVGDIYTKQCAHTAKLAVRESDSEVTSAAATTGGRPTTTRPSRSRESGSKTDAAAEAEQRDLSRFFARWRDRSRKDRCCNRAALRVARLPARSQRPQARSASAGSDRSRP